MPGADEEPTPRPSKHQHQHHEDFTSINEHSLTQSSSPSKSSRKSLRRPDDGLVSTPSARVSKRKSRRRSTSPGLTASSGRLKKSEHSRKERASEEKKETDAASRTSKAASNSSDTRIEQAFLASLSEDAARKKSIAGAQAPAMTPGVVAVTGSEKAASRSKSASNAKKATARGTSDNDAPMTPGAVAVPGPGATSSDNSNEQAILASMTEDDLAKKKSKRRAAPAVTPGALAVGGAASGSGDDDEQAALNAIQSDAAVKKSKSKSTSPAVTPGAVAVAGPGNHSSDDNAVLAGLSEHSSKKKRSARAGAARRAVVPGAVAVAGIDSDDDANNDANEQAMLSAAMDDAEKKKGASSYTEQERAQMTDMMERDALMKKGPKVAPAIAPGAEDVGPVIYDSDGNEDKDYHEDAAEYDLDKDDDKEDKDHHDVEAAVVTGTQVSTAEAGRYNEPVYQPVQRNQGLAVAEAVPEVEPEFLPAAVEFDPDAKPPIYKNRRFLLYGSLAALLLVGIVIGVVLGVTLGDDGPTTRAPTATPTLAPTSLERGEIVSRFLALIGEDVIIEGTPAYKATDWILNEDPMQLDESAENLEQRFLLALFYFSTTQKTDWRACGKPEEGEDANCVFDVLGFGFDPDGFDTEFYTQIPAIRWLSDRGECEWVGSLCDTVDTVRALDLWGNNITGPLPDMLSKFPFLQSISLAHNDFTGKIPEAYTEMRHLNNLELHFNMLTGTLSPNFYGADTLQNLNVGDNMLDGPVNGTGELSLSDLKELKGYHIFDNMFTGPFPTDIGQLRFLSFTRTGNNDFDQQQIPTDLGKLTLLQEMWFDGNRFSGSIPTEIALVSALTDLRVHNNQLTGPIPEELYTLTDLVLLFLEKNMLTGTLSPSISRLLNLEQIRLRENRISGPIPSELGRLPRLELAFLHRNLFTGPMPDEVCAQVECGRFNLEFLNADCGGDNPPNPCPCCTACCERGEGAELCFKTNFLDCPK